MTTPGITDRDHIDENAELAALEPTKAVDEYDDDESEEELKKAKRGKLLKRMGIIAVVAVAALFLVSRVLGGATPVQAAATYTYHEVARRDITEALKGSGTLKPANSYSVTTLISGDILAAPFEEGDIVEKDTVLYHIDSDSIASGIERSELSLAQVRRSYNLRLKSYEELQVKAKTAGTITELYVEEGDTVTAGQLIATVRDSSTMTLVLPFGSGDCDGFYVGQAAEVTIDASFERLSGRVTKIGAVEKLSAGNMLVRDVTIELENPGGISPTMSATAVIGGVGSSSSGKFSYKSEGEVRAGVAGDVTRILADEGDYVSKDQVVVSLASDTLENEIANAASSIREAELSLENQYNQLDNYTIESPIAGTIIEKNYKQGDTLESGKVLCTIFDLSYLEMTLNIDELDIANVSVGQKVEITAEAVPGRVYEGVVTKININGTTVSGVTSYPVTIRLDEIEGLLPGMNVDASIIVSESRDTLAVPVGAVLRGNRVLVQRESVGGPGGGETGGNPGGQGSATGQNSAIPEGFVMVEVEIGVADDEYIEILSGLSEGEVVAAEVVITTSMPFYMQSGPAMQQGGGTNVTYSSGGARP